MRRVSIASQLVVAGLVAATVGIAAPVAVEAHTTGIHDNCTKLNSKAARTLLWENGPPAWPSVGPPTR